MHKNDLQNKTVLNALSAPRKKSMPSVDRSRCVLVAVVVNIIYLPMLMNCSAVWVQLKFY